MKDAKKTSGKIKTDNGVYSSRREIWRKTKEKLWMVDV